MKVILKTICELILVLCGQMYAQASLDPCDTEAVLSDYMLDASQGLLFPQRPLFCLAHVHTA